MKKLFIYFAAAACFFSFLNLSYAETKGLYKNGKLKSEITYGDQIIYKEYYESGGLSSVMEISKSGRPTSTTMFYEGTDKVICKTPYSEGQPNGIYENYTPSGRAYFKCDYKNGKLQRPCLGYDESGNLADGILEIHAKSGKLYSSTEYVKGIPGKFKTYYLSGKVQYEGFYKNGKIDGVMKYYYESGQVRAEIAYQDGSLTGITKNYNENGRLTSQFEYKDWLPVGNS